ncbi:MAG TPA: PEGA domain-containing protein [Vicinamibacterales bacterium]
MQPQREIAVPRQDHVVAGNRASSNGRSYAYANNDGRRWDNRHYESYVTGVHRYNAYVVHPQVVRVIPYRPYAYHPSFSVGVYYGADGYYPYGYTPDYYFNPIPGHLYGGVRITGAPRDAQVFADGYYVGIVDDFDGIFQHMNLEAGPHHVEVAWGGYQPMAFDVYVRPGDTTTFRADGYFRY